MIRPRVRMNRSIAPSDSPAARRFSTLRANAAPARKTNVGAPSVVSVDGRKDLEVPRPPVDGDQAEPELPLRTVLEEVPPPCIVVLAESRMANREPGGLPSLTERLPRGKCREAEHHPDDERDHPSHPHVSPHVSIDGIPRGP